MKQQSMVDWRMKLGFGSMVLTVALGAPMLLAGCGSNVETSPSTAASGSSTGPGRGGGGGMDPTGATGTTGGTGATRRSRRAVASSGCEPLSSRDCELVARSSNGDDRVVRLPAMNEESFVELIARKRDGRRLSDEQIARLVQAHGAGELADYQMTALLMAVFLRGMDDAETVALTRAMLHSGDVIDLSSVPGRKVDKHSTGGVGDKVSICLAPLVAACGVPVPMVSGRGLGHTGGTLDKLEAIAGFRVDLDTERFATIVREVGTCMIGQTARIAPADKRIYALRDVTATVESIPLIVASILSKKLAEGIDALVLDVKVGRGAFMKTEESARALAEALVRVGTAAGKDVRALLTDMNAPLGRAVGNAIETREAIDILHGGGPADLRECTLALGAAMLVAGGAADDEQAARARLEGALADGAGAAVMERMVAAQGGDAKVVADPKRLALAPVVIEVVSETEGTVTSVDALEIGLSSVALGAGRTRADQAVDHAVGIELVATRGDRVERGQPLAKLYVRKREAGEALAERMRRAFRVEADGSPAATPLVIGRVG
jgi:pyrimidine-nucleoside phosphorylase